LNKIKEEIETLCIFSDIEKSWILDQLGDEDEN